jgi:hypothetical protein
MVEDTLPNLSLINGFMKYVAPCIFLFYLKMLHFVIKHSKDSEAKKRMEHSYIMIIASGVIINLLADKYKS